MDVSIGVRHSANWILNSATTGVRFTLVRPFIHTYLNLNGTPFTDRSGYETMTFSEEIQNRDNRLYQTIRTPYYSSPRRSEEHTSELQSRRHLVCRLLLEKKKRAKHQGT